MADFVISGLGALDEKLARLENSGKVLDMASAQMGETLVGRVKDLTPVDTGNLRQSWKRTRPKNGRVEVYNNTEYASHVEWGHRQKVGRYVPAIGKTLKKPFVEGSHMLRDAVSETKETFREDMTEILEGLLE